MAKMVGKKKIDSKSKSKFQEGAEKAGVPHSKGKGAMKGEYRSGVELSAGHSFTESIDLDTHFEAAEPDSNRWDYGVGVKLKNGTEVAFWVEPHPASSTGEAKVILKKFAWLKSKLDEAKFSGLKSLCLATVQQGHNPYRWQTSEDGKIRITAKSTEARLLAQNGIAMPAKRVMLP